MLPQVVRIVKFARKRRSTGMDSESVVGHLSDVFQNNGMVRSFGCVYAPAEGGMTRNQGGGNRHRIGILEEAADRKPGIFLVVGS